MQKIKIEKGYIVPRKNFDAQTFQQKRNKYTDTVTKHEHNVYDKKLNQC